MADFAYGFRQNTNYIITSNTLYEIGRNYRFSTSAPNQTAGSNNQWVAVSASQNAGGSNGIASAAIRTDGTLWSWGNNSFGQLGANTSTLSNISSPVQVGALSVWSSVSSAAQSMVAIQSNGTLWAWGNNGFGQLGLNTSTNYSSPVQVGALSNWATVLSTGYSSLSIVSNGSLYAWGRNDFGQLAQNNTQSYSSPVQVVAENLVYTQIGVGLGTGYAIRNNGTLWAIGRGVFGTLGTGSTTDSSSLVQVGSSSLWTSISGLRIGVLAIQTPGTLWAWGNNISGSLGLNTSGGTFSTPVQVGAVSGWTQVSGGGDYSLALRNDSTLWAWGNNGNGELGLNTLGGTFSTPVQVGSGATPYIRISAGNSHSGFIRSNGTLWMCGYNVRGQLGVNTSTTRITSLVQVGTLSVWTRISCGSGPGSLYGFSMAVQSNGTLWAWGNNGFGQLGLNTSTNYSSPVQVGALSVWTNIFCGYYSAVAVQSNGTLWSWGSNSLGQLGQNNQINYSSPVQVGSLGNWALPTGYIGQWTWASSSNQLYAWGDNAFGQLGQNSTSVPRASSPLQIGAVPTVTATKIASSWYSNYAIQSPGTLWAWGFNSSGQLGLGNTSNRSGAVQVGALNYWTQISAGGAAGQVAAIQSNGTLWAWGNNFQGQLGLSNTIDRSSPTQVGALTTWTQVACGYSHTAALQTPGTLWAWGTNSYGQLGNNSAGPIVYSPIQIGTASNWSRISCGYQYTIALQNNGTLWTWGLNSFGQLGYDTTSYRSSATQIGTVGVWTGFPQGSQNNFWGAAINSNNNLYVWGNNSNRILNSNYYIYDSNDILASGAIIANPVPLDPTLSTPIRSASIGDQFGVYVQSNGTLWSWGNNSFGQTANFSLSTGNQLVPSATYMNTWKQIACGYSFCLGLQSDGTIWSFGSNSYGQLGNNTTSKLAVSSPNQIGSRNTWTQISAGGPNGQVAAIQSPGTLWAWGDDAYGQLAQNNTLQYSSPVQIGALSIWTRVSVGSRHMLALQNNGTLWAWGSGGQFQLGNNSTTNVSSPIQIGALTSWAKISAGFFNSYAIQSNGTLWSWGLNDRGQLGISNTTNRSSPVQVGALGTWTQVYGGYLYALALQSNGTLWAWGQNTAGALGLGDNTNRSSPVQVGALAGWTSISASVYTSSAILNGALYMMGLGTSGQLGRGTPANSILPLQVGTASNWVQSAGGYFFSSGLQSTSVWSTWGQNTLGQLGYLATVSPLQIATQSTWSAVCCGLNYAMAVQNNGTLWAWGNNSYGQLGLGDLTHRSSLTQVGSISNWSRVACGYTHTAALQSNGTLWAWGVNSFGQLGQGNFINTSTPVQVGTISKYVTVYAMNFTTLAETQ